MTETIEYNSPIGVLKLTCSEDAVQSVLFSGNDQNPASGLWRHKPQPSLGRCLTDRNQERQFGLHPFLFN